MTRQNITRLYETNPGTHTLGAVLRSLRTEKDLPLWKVAAAAETDTAMLSKIELGQRLPTRDQTAALAKFFGIAVNELESMRMVEKFLSDNGHNPAAAALAAARIRETAGEYFVKTKRVRASKRTKQ